MTPQEATMKLDKVVNKYNDCFYCEGHTDEEWDAVDMAMKALEKQIPKKWFHDCGMYYCPVCNEFMFEGNYCPNCGQKIDWTE